MTTEARDALAAALYEANVARTLNAPIAEAILRNLPDGWVLARKQDAEDGAALRELMEELDPPCDIRIRLRTVRDERTHRLYLTADGGRLYHADTIAAAARKATEALR